MVRRILTGVLTLMLALNIGGCELRKPMPTVPEEKELPGKLVGVSYAKGSGMEYRTEFEIDLRKDEIVYTAFWPQDMNADEMEQREHISITDQQWAEVEQVIMSFYQTLQELTSSAESVKYPEPQILDGGDDTNFSLTWETEEGERTIKYYWPSDRRAGTLVDLLKELAEPTGRQITYYDEPELCKIYIARDHLVNRERDYSFQLHRTKYSAEEAHWELIYYLGDDLDNGGRIRLEQEHWDAFLALVENTRLEYFPERTEFDKQFICTLTYSDETYKNVVPDDETEERLKEFFMSMIE